jgi:hypothetical protein
MKTDAFVNFNRHLLLVDKLLVSAKQMQDRTETELWAEYSFEESETYKEDCIYKGLQEDRKESLLEVPDVISKLDEFETELELELSANYILNDEVTFTKYVDVIIQTICEHLNVNSKRLFKTKYSLIVEEGFFTDKEEEKKTLLLMNLPFRLIDREKINCYDLATYFYLTLKKNYESFVIAHNFLLNSKIRPQRKYSIREQMIAHRFRAEAKIEKAKDRDDWVKEFGQSGSNAYSTLNGKKKREPDIKEMRNVIELLSPFPDAQNLAQMYLDFIE